MENNVNHQNATNFPIENTLAQNLEEVNNEKITHPRLPHPKEEDVVLLSQSDLDYTAKAIYRFGTVIDNIMQVGNLKAKDLLERLNETYFPDVFSISRLINHEAKRDPKWGQAVELRRAFGTDLNALADGDKPLTMEQLSDAEVNTRFEQYSAEMSRRMRQKLLSNL